MLKNASKYKKNSIFALLNLTIMENNDRKKSRNPWQFQKEIVTLWGRF